MIHECLLCTAQNAISAYVPIHNANGEEDEEETRLMTLRKMMMNMMIGMKRITRLIRLREMDRSDNLSELGVCPCDLLLVYYSVISKIK